MDENGDGYADGILSTLADDSSGTRQPIYGFYQGTSMAVPHAAGVIALMKSGNPAGVTPDTVDNWLMAGDLTEDVSGDGADVRNDTYGYGLIDAVKAVQTAASGTVPTILTASPNRLDFGSALTDLTMTLAASGGGTVTVTTVTETADWLTFTAPGTVDGLGDYTVTVDRSTLSTGSYSTELTVEYEVDSEPRQFSVPVSLSVGGTTSTSGDTGFTWIILVNVNSGALTTVDNADNQGGIYSYAFNNIPAGSYYVIAGSDSDNDGYLCDAGESCGAYMSLSDLRPVTVGTSNVTGINFTTSFPSALVLTSLSGNEASGDAGFLKGITTKGLSSD